MLPEKGSMRGEEVSALPGEKRRNASFPQVKHFMHARERAEWTVSTTPQNGSFLRP